MVNIYPNIFMEWGRNTCPCILLISSLPMVKQEPAHPIFPLPQQWPELVINSASWDNQTFILEDLSIIRSAALDCGEYMTVITVPGGIRGPSESIHLPANPKWVVDTQVPHDSHHESRQPVSPTFLVPHYKEEPGRATELSQPASAAVSQRAKCQGWEGNILLVAHWG